MPSRHTYIDDELPQRSPGLLLMHNPTEPRPSGCCLEDSSLASSDTLPTLELPKSSRRRPDAPRSTTDPTPAPPSFPNVFTPVQPASIQRARSPYSRSHLRSRSSGAALSVPAMTRSHSWAGNSAARTSDSTASSTASSSPPGSVRSSPRTRSPFKTHEDTFSHNATQKTMWYDMHGSSAIESIQEDSELDLTPRGPHIIQLSTPSFSRSSSLRRRPASPLHSLMNAPAHAPSPLATDLYHHQPSPALAPQRYNETHPALHHYASSSSFSSISSTPTSQRSRSPSISSLETIEDAPDLESEAIEAERIERLKLAAERADADATDDDPLRRRSLDAPRGFGFARPGAAAAALRERKRWSVCGGERRADLDLETIWED